MEINELVSIIVPVYNADKTLKRCVDSILMQKYGNWELILVDDGSKDESGSICDLYAAKNPQIVVFHKSNGGVSSARNIGLQHANGKYVTFIDSDDYITESYISDFLSVNADLVVCGMYNVYQDQRITPFRYERTIYHVKDGIGGGKYLLTMPMMAPWAKLFNMDIIRNNSIKFDEDMRFAEDNVFVLEYLAHCSSIYYLESCSYYYQVGRGKYVLDFSECQYGLHRMYQALLKYSQYIKEDLHSIIEDKVKMYYLFFMAYEYGNDISYKGFLFYKNNIKKICGICLPNPSKQRIILKLLYTLLKWKFYLFSYILIHTVYGKLMDSKIKNISYDKSATNISSYTSV